MVRDPITGRAGTLVTGEASDPLESTTAAISWPAITGGAYVAASSSLIKFRPRIRCLRSNTGGSATTFKMTAIWLIIVQCGRIDLREAVARGK